MLILFVVYLLGLISILQLCSKMLFLYQAWSWAFSLKII